MAEGLVSSSSSPLSEVGELWKENKGGGWVAVAAITFIFLWQIFKFVFPVFRGFIARFRRTSSPPPLSLPSNDASLSSFRISDLVSDGDLKSLIDNLDEKASETENPPQLGLKRMLCCKRFLSCCTCRLLSERRKKK